MAEEKLITIDEILEEALGSVSFKPIANTIALNQNTKVYRITLELDEENTATFPTPDNTAIPTKQAYFDYEIEVTVPAEAEILTDSLPASWAWLTGGELPILAADFAGKTLHIAARLDCYTRNTLANIWRISDAN